MRTQKEVRQAFWQYLSEVDTELYKLGKRSKRQNEQCTDIRCAFVDWLDSIHRGGLITDKQAQNYAL